MGDLDLVGGFCGCDARLSYRGLVFVAAQSNFKCSYRLGFAVFGVGPYRGVPVHLSYAGCVHYYFRLVYCARAKSGFPLFVPSGFSEVEYEKNRFEVHQFNN